MDNKPKVTFTLYWLEKSRAQRILWLLEELQLDYEVKTYKRQQGGRAPAELKNFHPLGKSPILTVQSETLTKPLVLAESGNIIEYLIDHYGSRLAPKKFPDGQEGKLGGETEGWMRYRYYMHYAEGSLMPYLVIALVMNAIKSSAPFIIKPIANAITSSIETKFLAPNFETNFDFLESQIASSPNNGEYLGGSELSGADIVMSFPLSAAKGRAGFTEQKYPKLWAYVEKLEGIGSHQRAVQKIIDIEGSYHPTL